MLREFYLPVCLVMAVTLWIAVRHALAVRHASRQLEIAQRGASCEGKVVAIQRPFMLDSCTRLYFDFVPHGREETVRVCHVDRRPTEEQRPALPAAGATVTVRYLPDRPQQAVIGKLVPHTRRT
jgi:hypothetical protein